MNLEDYLNKSDPPVVYYPTEVTYNTTTGTWEIICVNA